MSEPVTSETGVLGFLDFFHVYKVLLKAEIKFCRWFQPDVEPAKTQTKKAVSGESRISLMGACTI